MTAAHPARDLDPQHLGHVVTPRRPDLHLTAADGHVVGVHHDAGPGDEDDMAAAYVHLELQRRLGDDGLGEVQLQVTAADPRLDPLRHYPPALAFGVPAAGVDAHDLLGPGRRRAARGPGGGQIGDQPGQLAVGPRGQGQLQALVEFLRGQPPVSRRHPQQLDHPVPVLVRGAQLTAGHLMARLGIRHGKTINRAGRPRAPLIPAAPANRYAERPWYPRRAPYLRLLPGASDWCIAARSVYLRVMTDMRVTYERTAAPPAVTESLAVDVCGLRMSYGSTEVLRGVDFGVHYGEVFCLLGPNGAGKTTTLEILEGFRAPTGGTARVLGLDPVTQSAKLRERAGMVLQECGFPRQARVAELIDTWRSYYPNPLPLGELLELVELTEKRNTQVRKLSGGQRRRLDFALALAGRPDLVFLDEPTTGFDPEARQRCWAAIENLRRLGTTIVLTTHYLDEAERLADRIAILRAGRIELAGTTREVAVRAGLATRISFTTPAALRRGQVSPPAGIELAVRGPVSVCHTDNAALTLRWLLDWALENRLGDLDGLAVTAPSLEDTYLQLTGTIPDPV